MSNQSALNVHNWNPELIQINTVPNKGTTGIKKFKLTSKQTNRNLLIQTPIFQTWGIQDYVDKEKGDGKGDGKFTLSLNFPLEQNEETNLMKEKINKFYDKIVDILTENSKLFFGGKQKSKDLIKESGFPILKYPKIKESNDCDYSKEPNIKVKIQNMYDQTKNGYTDKLDVKIFDENRIILYPNDNEDDVPMNYITKLSTIISIIRCNSIWIGPATWGVSFVTDQILLISQGEIINSDHCYINLNNTNNEIKSNLVSSSFNITPKSETFINDDDDDDNNDTNNVNKLNDDKSNDKSNDKSDDDESDDDESDNKSNLIPKTTPEPDVKSEPAVVKKPIFKRVVKKSS
jgi:hypothetical protein